MEQRRGLLSRRDERANFADRVTSCTWPDWSCQRATPRLPMARADRSNSARHPSRWRGDESHHRDAAVSRHSEFRDAARTTRRPGDEPRRPETARRPDRRPVHGPAPVDEETARGLGDLLGGQEPRRRWRSAREIARYRPGTGAWPAVAQVGDAGSDPDRSLRSSAFLAARLGGETPRRTPLHRSPKCGYDNNGLGSAVVRRPLDLIRILQLDSAHIATTEGMEA